MDVLLYGAYGYTAQLMLDKARYYGINPLLAGRHATKLQAVAQQYDLPYAVIDLADRVALEDALMNVEVVIHAAGPFRYTAKPMVEACLHTKTHYLDITGEIDIFEYVHTLDQAAKDAGILLMPGTGFDVVPTDCLAAYLKEKLPTATHLQLAFSSAGGTSQGTALTMVESLGEKGMVREKGQLISVPIGHKTMRVPFIDKELFTMTIPWGDVSTAYYTTGIPHIETYAGIKPGQYKWVKRSRWINGLLKTRLVRNLAKNRVKAAPPGPSEEVRAGTYSQVWGKVWDDAGQSVAARMRVKDGYSLTALTCLTITRRVLEGNWKAGHWTPAGLYGADLIMEVEGSVREEVISGKDRPTPASNPG